MLVYKCGRCGEVLYVYPGGEGRILTPLEVAGRYNYTCPRCGSRVTGVMNPDWREHIRMRPRMVAGGEVH